MNALRRCKLCGEETAKASLKLKDRQLYRCGRCDFHFLDQLDDIATIEADSKGLDQQAWNYIEARVGESDLLLPHRLALVKEFISLPGAQCLDLGAGVGQFMLQLQKEPVACYGIEPSGVRREYARQKYRLNLRQELVDDDYWQNSFAEFFDAICLWDVIEHVNFPRETLAATCRLLKPGGYLFLDTPSRETISYRLSEKLYRFSSGRVTLFLDNFYSSAPYGHKQIFTSRQLLQLIEQHDLQICNQRNSYVSSLLRGDKHIFTCRKPAF